MSGFDAGWLALREPADARARDPQLARRLAEWLGESKRPTVLVDLGCGTGANRRVLGPLLPEPQRWICVDDDPELLRLAARDAESLLLDLSSQLEQVPVRQASVITASALLDLVSSDWLAQLLGLVSGAQVALLLALTYDGRMRFEPANDDDLTVQGLFDAHQRRDKGLGPALGPTAPAVASAMLAAIGFELMHCRSDWLLDASHEPDAALLRPLLEGIAAAAMEQQPASGSQVQSWLAARRDELRSGRLRARIGHVDLLALPRG